MTHLKRCTRFTACLGILALLPTGLAVGQQATAGHDLLETCSPPDDPNITYQEFSAPCSVPGFMFDTGCSDFTGTVPLRGKPGGQLGVAADLGMTDTIVRRLANTTFPNPNGPFPTSSMIPIELVSLSLVSVSPITVTGCSGGSQLWDVIVTDAPGPPLTAGSMTITKTHADGGTFTSSLNVCPLLTFRRKSDGQNFSIDACAVNSECEVKFMQLTGPGCWSHAAPADLVVQVPGLTSNFVPGYCPGRDSGILSCPDGGQHPNQRQKKLTPEQAMRAAHGITPANPKPPIPALTGWGMILLATLLLAVAVLYIHRRNRAAPAQA